MNTDFFKTYLPYAPCAKEKYLLRHQYSKYKHISNLSEDDLSTPFMNGYLTIIRHLVEKLKLNEAILPPALKTSITYAVWNWNHKEDRVELVQYLIQTLKCTFGGDFLFECMNHQCWNVFRFAAQQAECVNSMTVLQMQGLMVFLLSEGYFVAYKWLLNTVPHFVPLKVSARHISSKYFHKLPLEDVWWRKELFEASVEKKMRWSDQLIELVQNKKFAIEESKKILKEVALLPDDILKYCICSYI